GLSARVSVARRVALLGAARASAARAARRARRTAARRRRLVRRRGRGCRGFRCSPFRCSPFRCGCARALQVANAHAHELDVLADRVVAVEAHVFRVVALPCLVEFERLGLAAVVLDACHDVVRPRRSGRAIRDLDGARNASDVVPLAVLSQRRRLTLERLRLGHLERDVDLLLGFHRFCSGGGIALRRVAVPHARAARCRLTLRYVPSGGASLIGRGCRAPGAEDLLSISDRDRKHEGRQRKYCGGADPNHVAASDEESRLGHSSYRRGQAYHRARWWATWRDPLACSRGVMSPRGGSNGRLPRFLVLPLVRSRVALRWCRIPPPSTTVRRYRRTDSTGCAFRGSRAEIRSRQVADRVAVCRRGSGSAFVEPCTAKRTH